MRRAKPKFDKTYVDYVELQTGTKETARKKRHERNGTKETARKKRHERNGTKETDIYVF
jgi:hypothetical protein